MQRFEYRALPAPKKGKKAKGVRGSAGRFAHGVTEALNEMAAEGWDYVRSDTMPSEERSGLTSKTTVFQTVMIFRRPLLEGAEPEPLSAEDYNAFADDTAEDRPEPPLTATEAETPDETPSEPAPERATT